MKIALIIASRGRAQLLATVLNRWAGQTRLPDHCILSLTSVEDVGELRPGFVSQVLVGSPGLCRQRNRALDFLQTVEIDVVIFADDDYVPSRTFVQGVEQLMSDNADIAVTSGKMLADGVTTGGIAYDDAVRLVERYDATPDEQRIWTTNTVGGYGCNMAIRVSADRSVRCDERLPLYGWQEDVDYTRQYRKYGRIVQSNAFAGVHMGTQSARSPGKRLGYSQIANPIYLMAKGTMPAKLGLRLMCRNFLANLYGTVRGDALVDRPGRLRGNLVGFGHLLTGRIDPEHMLRF